MSELKGACVIGQSGGPTSEINSSVLGAGGGAGQPVHHPRIRHGTRHQGSAERRSV